MTFKWFFILDWIYNESIASSYLLQDTYIALTVPLLTDNAKEVWHFKWVSSVQCKCTLVSGIPKMELWTEIRAEQWCTSSALPSWEVN